MAQESTAVSVPFVAAAAPARASKVYGVMVDIETLSTRDDAAIISIGLAAFDLDKGVIDTEGYAINLPDVFGHVDPVTVGWWMNQDGAAKTFSFSGGGTATSAATRFANFFYRHRPQTVWAYSPQFDLVKLKNWWNGIYANTKPPFQVLPWPVSYKQERDARTLKDIAAGLGIAIPVPTGTYHSPVDDAANQAREVVAILNALGKFKSAP